MTASELGAQLESIENVPPRYSVSQNPVAVGAACAAFAFLNGLAAARFISQPEWLRE
jgi:uncharacterized membrane protein YjjP (DUF1212 family)